MEAAIAVLVERGIGASRAYGIASGIACIVACTGCGTSSAKAPSLPPNGEWRPAAIHYLERAERSLAPFSVERVQLARLMARLNRIEEATRIARSLLAPEDRVRAKLAVADILLRRERVPDARNLQREALKTLTETLTPAKSRPIFLNAAAALSLADFEGKRGVSHRAHKTYANQARERFARGAAARGDAPVAERMLTESGRQGVALAWLGLAEAAASGGKRKLGARWLNRAMTETMTTTLDTNGLARAGTLALRIADVPLANKLVKAYGVLFESKPHSSYASLDIGLLAHRLGDTAHAIRIVDAAYLEVRGLAIATRAQRLPYVAQAYHQLGLPGRARALLKETLAAAGAAEPRRRQTLLRAAKGFTEIGDIERARVLAREYDGAASAEVFIALADHYLRKGKRDEAKEALAEVAESISETPTAAELPLLTQLAERYYRALDNDAAVWALDAYTAGIEPLKQRARAVALIRLVRTIMRTRLVPETATAAG